MLDWQSGQMCGSQHECSLHTLESNGDLLKIVMPGPHRQRFLVGGRTGCELAWPHNSQCFISHVQNEVSDMCSLHVVNMRTE